MSHTCHWAGCPVEVPAKLRGCKPHWFALPRKLRNRIWAAYRPGQEIEDRPRVVRSISSCGMRLVRAGPLFGHATPPSDWWRASPTPCGQARTPTGAAPSRA